MKQTLLIGNKFRAKNSNNAGSKKKTSKNGSSKDVNRKCNKVTEKKQRSFKKWKNASSKK